MKKILFWIFGICIISFVLFESSFAATLSFVTKDGTVFCETDTFDGQYKVCNPEQMVSPDLGQSWRYGPQLVETPQAKICVEKGREVDKSLCGVIETQVSTVVTKTGIMIEDQPGSEDIISSTGESLVIPVVALTGTINSGSVVPVSGSVAPTVTTSLASSGTDDLGNIYIINGWEIIQSLQSSFLACIWSIPNAPCAVDSSRIMQSIENIGIYLIWGILLFVGFCCIFWWMMFVHVLLNPISNKILWIFVMLIFSIFGAIAYYIIVNRSYITAQLTALPPKPPSFFD